MKKYGMKINVRKKMMRVNYTEYMNIMAKQKKPQFEKCTHLGSM